MAQGPLGFKIGLARLTLTFHPVITYMKWDHPLDRFEDKRCQCDRRLREREREEKAVYLPM